MRWVIVFLTLMVAGSVAAAETVAFTLSRTNVINTDTGVRWTDVLILSRTVSEHSSADMEIVLMESESIQNDGYETVHGLNHDTVSVSNLGVGVYHIRLETLSEGSGGWIIEGNILIQLTEAGWRELFRDYVHSFVKCGINESHGTHCRFSIDSFQMVTLQINEWDKTVSDTMISLSLTDVGGERFVRHINTVSMFNYDMTSKGLAYRSGYRYSDIVFNARQAYSVHNNEDVLDEFSDYYGIPREKLICYNRYIDTTYRAVINQYLPDYEQTPYEVTSDLSGETKASQPIKENLGEIFYIYGTD